MKEDRMLTTKEAAQCANVGQKTIRFWLSQGKLKGHKLGPRLWRIRESDLQLFLESQNMIAPGALPDFWGKEVWMEIPQAHQQEMDITIEDRRALVFLLKTRHNTWGQLIEATVQYRGETYAIDGHKITGFFKIPEEP